MLTGRVPFNGDTTVAIAIKHIQEDLPSPVEYNDEIPISVEKIVLKCCQKSPDRRYQSAAELIADLKRSLITPDKDFVNLVDPDEEGATRVASSEEVNSAKNGNGRLSDTEQMRLREDVMNKYEKDDHYDDYNSDRKGKRRDYDDEDDDFYGYSGDRRRKQPQGPGRMEKLTIAMAVVLALLLGFMVILLVGRSIGLFGAGDDSTAASSLASNGNGTSSVAATDNADGIVIPDDSGQTYAEAVSNLNAKGFKVEKAEDAGSTLAKDVVSYTNPASGNRAKSGATVTVFVSTGANYTANAASTQVSTAKSEGQVTVPNVIGLSSEDAVITLVEAGLSAGNIVETSNEDSNLTGLICAQSIAFGTSVSEGTIINMELSTGPARVTYSYTADIAAPTEGENYTAGVSVHVTLVTSDGTTLLNTTTTDFPIQMNSKGITSPTGTLTFVYTAVAPSTTNPETGEVTGGESKEITVTRAVTFNQEN
jgi:serine/threonine-protein kinase